jgi:hypothetical protein
MDIALVCPEEGVSIGILWLSSHTLFILAELEEESTSKT